MNALLLAVLPDALAGAGLELGRDFSVGSVGGGCIHDSYVIRDGARSWFVKTNAQEALNMFEAERDALSAIAATDTVRVPQPLALGSGDCFSFLVMEHLNLSRGTDGSYAALGAQLAQMHRRTSPDGRFGWPRDNFIGATQQPNAWHRDWGEFWRTQRLEHQFRLASDKGMRFAGSEQLLEQIDVFFTGRVVIPSLLHGDLWGGNASSLDDGTPVIFDPASYFGDRETDLAFTEFFGGFPASFYRAYDGAFPRDDGWQVRRDLYNLYHALNHFNLFGGGYASQAQQMIRTLNHSAGA